VFEGMRTSEYRKRFEVVLIFTCLPQTAVEISVHIEALFLIDKFRPVKTKALFLMTTIHIVYFFFFMIIKLLISSTILASKPCCGDTKRFERSLSKNISFPLKMYDVRNRFPL
jgi:hypothetical protein